MSKRKTSRKRALAGRAQLIGRLMFNEWLHNPIETDTALPDVMAHAYERGWRDCMAAARREELNSYDALREFLKPLR